MVYLLNSIIAIITAYFCANGLATYSSEIQADKSNNKFRPQKFPVDILETVGPTNPRFFRNPDPDNFFIRRTVPRESPLPYKFPIPPSITPRATQEQLIFGKRKCATGPIFRGSSAVIIDDKFEADEFVALCRTAILRKHKLDTIKLTPRLRQQPKTSKKDVSALMQESREFYFDYRFWVALEKTPPPPDPTPAHYPKPTTICWRKDLYRQKLVQLLGKEVVLELDNWIERKNRYLFIPCRDILKPS